MNKRGKVARKKHRNRIKAIRKNRRKNSAGEYVKAEGPVLRRDLKKFMSNFDDSCVAGFATMLFVEEEDDFIVVELRVPTKWEDYLAYSIKEGMLKSYGLKMADGIFFPAP